MNKDWKAVRDNLRNTDLEKGISEGSIQQIKTDVNEDKKPAPKPKRNMFEGLQNMND